MTKITTLTILALALSAVSAARASTITYNVNLSIGATGSVTGTITTDGVIGALGESDILAWSLSLSDGTESGVLTNVASQSGFDSSLEPLPDFTATSTQLLFNFSNSDNGEAYFTSGPGGSAFCFGPSNGLCDSGNQGNVETIRLRNASNMSVYTSETFTGSQVIATAPSTAPEPATFAVFSSGAVALAMLRRRQRAAR